MADQTTATGDNTADSTGSGNTQNAGKTFTQAELDAVIADRLTRAEQSREKKQAEKVTRATADADRVRMAEEKRYSDLAEANRKEADKAKAEAETHKDALRTYHLKDAFRLQAGKAKLSFASEQASEDAFALLDQTGVDMAEDGTVKGMDKALEGLKASRPYLFAAPASANANVNAADGRGNAPADDAARVAEVTKRFRLAR